MSVIPDRIGAIVDGHESDPFGFRGMHVLGDGTVVVRAFHPGATTMEVVDGDGGLVAPLERVHPAGVFAGTVGRARFAYRLRARDATGIHLYEDAYRFGPILGELDAWLIAKGDHRELYGVLGAHPCVREGIAGTTFAVWAPNARRVSVVGDWNGWDGRVHPMRLRAECGVWEIFVPGVRAGDRYKYELLGPDGALLPLKTDPLAFRTEVRPANAGIVVDPPAFAWHDAAWMASRSERQRADRPISIYEVHLGSWRRAEGNRFLSYRDLAETLVPYARDLGFTHLELLPVTEHPFDGSWGYQSTGWYAPTSRFGTPDDLRAFVDAAHAAGLGVIVDFVPGHFPTDAWSLGQFDGTHLYEHADPRLGMHYEWGTYVFNHGRAEVANFLLASVRYWMREFHVDALRVDAVSSMIYLDYSRQPGEWIPNRYGGNENLESTAFLRRLTATVREEGGITIAEESTAWPGVTAPAEHGGLGFDAKWNMGWMHDTLRFFGRDPLWRSSHLDDISFGLVYAFSERFVLPLSHDEVVHGKKSIIGRMPGTLEQRFGDLRALLAEMYAHPGGKLLFSGAEFGQHDEWNAARSLDWHLTDWEIHRGVTRLVADLNRFYRERPELHERDAAPDGFSWIQYDDARNGVVAWIRWSAGRARHLVAVLNASGVRLDGYRLGVPAAGAYAEILNTDAQVYGGANEGNLGGVTSEPVPAHGHAQSLVLTLPPRSVVWLAP